MPAQRRAKAARTATEKGKKLLAAVNAVTKENVGTSPSNQGKKQRRM